MKQLTIPEAARRDEKAVEMLRVWIAERQLHCSMKVGMYHDSARVMESDAWGTVLADVARHLANAMHERNGQDRDVFISQIVRRFLKELKFPTSGVGGAFV